MKTPSKLYRNQYSRIAKSPTVKGKKWCWVATETHKGWRLKLCVGDKLEFQLRGLLLVDPNDVQTIAGRDGGGILFVHLSDTTWFEVDGKLQRVPKNLLRGARKV